jgi:hypothetical protein
MSELALRGVLGVLAIYHLFIGVVSVGPLRGTARVTRAFYGLAVPDDPRLAYAVRMLGFYACALGVLLLIASGAPEKHRDVIAVVAVLQLMRAVSRIVSRRDLALAFRLSPRRNAFNAVLLVVEAAILILCFPSA